MSEQNNLDRVARALLTPLGYSSTVDWERTWVGNNVDSPETGSLAYLCRDLARIAIETHRQIGRPQEDLAPHEEVECALALFRELKRFPGQRVAVKIDGPAGWTVTRPTSQEAIEAALSTGEAHV